MATKNNILVRPKASFFGVFFAVISTAVEICEHSKMENKLNDSTRMFLLRATICTVSK